MLETLAVNIFGKLLAPYLDSFDSLKDSLRKGGMKYSVLEYISLITLVAAITFVGFLVGSLIFVSLLFPIPIAFFFAVVISFMSGAIAFVLGYLYPSMEVNSRKGKIEKALPFAVFYMATTASSGAHPVNIFRMLSLRGGVMGAEAARIYSNVKTLGMDINTAMQKAAAKTASPRFAELLWGMTSILTTGGDLETYLQERTKSAMAQYRRTLNDYAKTIAFYTEIYITLIIVGSLFFIILLAIISPLVGGNTLLLQTFLVFFFTPLVSTIFIVVLRGASPTE